MTGLFAGKGGWSRVCRLRPGPELVDVGGERGISGMVKDSGECQMPVIEGNGEEPASGVGKRSTTEALFWCCDEPLS